jgi:prolyl oligopeptidase
MYKYLLTILAISLFACSQEKKEEPKMNYPESTKLDSIEVRHGDTIRDPYVWLEDDRSKETEAWVEAQNKVTFDYLSKIPFRDDFKKRITDLNNYPKISAPSKHGEYYFFTKNDGLQNQSVYYYKKGLEGKEEVFFDPNTLSEDGTVAASIASFSGDDKYAVLSVQKSGSDWTTFKVMEVETKKELEDEINWVKFSGASWYKDGFFYSRYDEPKAGDEFKGKNEYHKLYYHKLGDPQEKDVLVHYFPNHPQRNIYAGTTEDERFLLIYYSEGTGGQSLMVKDLSKSKDLSNMNDVIHIVQDFNNEHSVVGNFGDELLMVTNIDAPMNRLVKIDTKKASKENWQVLIPETKDLLQGVSKAGGKLFVSYLKDATDRYFQYDYSGKMEKEIELPGIGSAGGFGGKDDQMTLFYTFTSFNYAPTVFKYDVATGNSEKYMSADVKFNPEDFEVNQVFYTSKDGTKVPMFIVNKKGIKLDGNNPTLLYGYGGFNISLTPSFSPSRISLLEQGGIFVMANLRGGGEYGEEWHKAGTKMQKQNVFDDFIAAAQYLIDNKYTSSEKLAIQGGSNGGLLVGACMTQRPDLYKVAFPAVGVLDMLKFHRFTIGWAWMDDYGNPEEEEMFNYIKKYSPYHNLKEGTKYPSTMVTTADHDDRVVPAHSFKFAARLQEYHSGANPVLIRIETKAGHGAGKSLTKAIEEVADLYSFMFYEMGVTPKF